MNAIALQAAAIASALFLMLRVIFRNKFIQPAFAGKTLSEQYSKVKGKNVTNASQCQHPIVQLEASLICRHTTSRKWYLATVKAVT